MLRILHLILQPAAVSFPSKGRLTKFRTLSGTNFKMLSSVKEKCEFDNRECRIGRLLLEEKLSQVALRHVTDEV